MVDENSQLIGADSSHHLTKGTKKRSIENEMYEEVDDEMSLSGRTKIVLYVVGSIVGLGFMYLFIIYLPQKYVPETRNLEEIVKIQELDVELKPISSERALQLHSGIDTKKIAAIDDADEDTEDPYEGEVKPREDRTSETVISKQASEENVEKSRGVERLILLGDVHGNYKPLHKLLTKLNYNKESDHVILVGDFTCKGPDSLDVVDYAIKNNFDCVLGNHEYYLLQFYAKFHHLKGPKFSDGETGNSFAAFGFEKDPDFFLAKKIQPEHVEYINKCSVIKKLGEVPAHKNNDNDMHSHAEGVAAHAGLRWDLPLEDQDPVECLEMRSYIGPFYNETTDDPKAPNAKSWSKIFNRKQKQFSSKDRKVIYYGHDARRGLSLKRYTKGLDSGCNRGEFLSAMVIWKELSETGEDFSAVNYKDMVVQTEC